MNTKVLPFLLLFATAVSLAETTNSVKYAEFNEDSPARNSFVLSQNGRVNARLAKSSNRTNLEAFLKTTLEGEKKIRTVVFKNGDKIVAVDKGLHLAQEVTFIPKEGERQVLFSTLQVSRKNQYRISGLQLNPSRHKLSIIVYPNGSRDDSYLYVIDLQAKKIILSHYFFSASRVFWVNDEELLFRDISQEGTLQIKSMKLIGETEPSVTVLYSRYDIVGSDFDKIFISSIERDHFIVLSRSHPPLEVTGMKDCNFEAEIDGKMFCSRRNYKNGLNFTDIFSFDWEDPQLKLERTIPGNIVTTYLSDSFFAYVDQAGFQKTVYYNDRKSGITGRLPVPDYVTVDMINETENPGELELELSSDLKSKTVTWKTNANDLIFDDTFKKEMLESENLSLHVKFLMVKSFDGTPIPVHIVYKKDTNPSKAPVLMEAYGGFDSSGYLDPAVNKLKDEFIKRGGVYVGPGIRGGNEYGEAWHQAGMREKKIKTYEDLASVAKYLIDSGISEKNKIAIAGTSNGGLTVSATGLLFPQYFGLVLATNGVLDLMSKQMLDRRYDGWKDDYGDPTIASDAEYLAQISPLENVAKAENGPAFQILNGRKDTRVNPAHSFKFAKAAEDLRAAGKNVNVELLSLNNSGHGLAAPDNDFISLRYRLVFWTRIYDTFGMSF